MSTRGYGTTEEFSQSLARIVRPAPESNPRFWNPNQAGVLFAPDSVMRKLKDIDPDLSITWDNFAERWIIWVKNPKLVSAVNRGWTLLFILRYADGSHMPLDERLFARIYEISAHKWGNAKQYFDSVEREWERDRELVKKNREDDVKYSAGEYFDFMKIKNYGSGNKFVNHFS